MRQTLNLLAEVLALPFSELFLQNDLLGNCIVAAKSKIDNRHDLTSELKKQLELIWPQTAEYINRHTTFHDTNHLQDIINYVYKPDEILYNCPELTSPIDIVNRYYITHIMRIAESFLTTRNGRIAFKFWPSSCEAYPLFKLADEGNAYSSKVRPLLDSNFETHRVEAWHALSRCIPESILISGYMLKLSEDFPDVICRQSAINILHQIGNTVNISDTMLDKTLAQGLAETHLHTGASRSFDLIWEEALEYERIGQACKSGEPPIYAREALIVRMLLAVYLRSGCMDFRYFILSENGGTIETVHSHAFSMIMDELRKNGKHTGLFSLSVKRVSRFISNLTGQSRSNSHLSYILDIPQGLQRNSIGLAERCFTAFSMMHIVDNPSDVYFASVFVYYLRLKSWFYRYCTQDSRSKGLKYFQRYYKQSTRAGTKKSMDGVERRLSNNILSAIRDERIVKTELRASIPEIRKVHPEAAERAVFIELKKHITLFIQQHLYSVAILYGSKNNLSDLFHSNWSTARVNILRGDTNALRRFLEEFGVNTARIHHHRLGIIYHFIKSGEKKEDSPCFIESFAKPEILKYRTFSFGITRFECKAAVKAISRMRKLCPEVSKLIVGLDAASLELPTEPWVYAPIFRLARDIDLYPVCQNSSADNSYRKTTLGLTYHVGEEFRHPLSGLRHIGEASEFYKLHAGDRLGHALALGIDIEKWFSSHGLTAMPIIEWMENCLWAWELIAKKLTSEHAQQHTAFLENQILSCADRIFGTLNGISVEKLCSAYRSKTLPCEDMIDIANKWCNSLKSKSYNIGIDFSRETNCPKCGTNSGYKFFPCIAGIESQESWSEESLVMSYHCSFFKSRMDTELLHEPSKQEIQISMDIQKYLRKRISEKGIIIEENPSSNAIVGEIYGILSHPISNLRNEANSSAVIATINTDDPSVFNASLANEYALIYYALIHNGYSVEKALNEVDLIRKAGLSSSFIGSVPSFEELLREYEQIIRAVSEENP